MARRLAAIMFTDIAGYTQLSQTDEPGALRLLQEQEKLVRPLLAVHQGRRVKSTGDGLLLEFDDALDAVECGAELQRQVHERNAQADARPLQIRVGIHLGDVQRRGTDILGDAVNIASRIEPLAEPGGVCISEHVFAQVRNKVAYPLEKLGPKNLKGIREPIDVYRVVLPWVEAGGPARGAGLPRLAVLPLANISSDPENEYFADGLTEELITVLSQLHGLRVIARTSVASYKATPKSISQIGAELGVGAILEGSVRRAGNQVRITAQLIDVGSEEHTWVATFDRKLDDIFAIQTEVARQIADALNIKVASTEVPRLAAIPTARPESYLAYLKGRSLLARGRSTESTREAKAQFEKAISIDPSNARAYAGLADAIRRLVWWGGYDGPRPVWDNRGRTNATRAVELEPNLAEGHFSLAEILWEDHDYRAAEEEFKRALQLNSNLVEAHDSYAGLLMDEGRTDEALREIALAEELDPQSLFTLHRYAAFLTYARKTQELRAVTERMGNLAPDSAEYHNALAWYCFTTGDVPSALREATTARALDASGHFRYRLALLLAATGEGERALSLLREIKEGAHTTHRTDALAGVYALLGDFDQAFRFLFEGLGDHALSFQRFRVDPLFEPLRKDPRFGELLRRMNLA